MISMGSFVRYVVHSASEGAEEAANVVLDRWKAHVDEQGDVWKPLKHRVELERNAADVPELSLVQPTTLGPGSMEVELTTHVTLEAAKETESAGSTIPALMLAMRRGGRRDTELTIRIKLERMDIPEASHVLRDAMVRDVRQDLARRKING